MAESKYKRRQILDPAVADLLAGMEERQAENQLPRKLREKKQRERAKIQARRSQRVTFDLPSDLKLEIMQLAESEKIPASQLVTLALIRFLHDLADGVVDPGRYKVPSRSPRYEWVLDLSEERNILKNEKK